MSGIDAAPLPPTTFPWEGCWGEPFFGPADKMDGDTTPKLHWVKMHSDMSGIDQTSSDTAGVQYDSMVVAAAVVLAPLSPTTFPWEGCWGKPFFGPVDKMDGDTTPKLH